MAQTHNLGYPRIGKNRELKIALENYWSGRSTAQELLQQGAQIRQHNWRQQCGLDWSPANDFSNYDHILDTTILLGNIPHSYAKLGGTDLDLYFRMARGRSACDCGAGPCHAQEMTKWFDTNYHYLVPEFSQDSQFTPNPSKLLAEISEAQALGHKIKPVLVGPITYLLIGKSKDSSDKLAHLPQILQAYTQILCTLAEQGLEWIQLDEPILSTQLDPHWARAIEFAYQELSSCKIKILLANYFGELKENLSLLLRLPVHGIHIDAVRGADEIPAVVQHLGPQQVLSLGVVDGRNVWKSDLNALLDRLEPIHQNLGDRLWIAPSCSLLHVPVSLERETELDLEVRSWLAFAQEKIQEIQILGHALNQGRSTVHELLAANAKAIQSRQNSPRVYNPVLRQHTQSLEAQLGQRQSPYEQRAQLQHDRFQLPLFPTTTIGSFPQTAQIRTTRAQFKKGSLALEDYTKQMQAHIAHAVQVQEELGLDVLVHGEAERNDMVEYFGENLHGFVFTAFGWVQSYGSRCVKPPILYGDVLRKKSMTTQWIQYAQSLTNKPMKGMLTGPVTILNWSFVRNDQPRSETCTQIALAIRDEVLELEQAGIKIIQIDEAALREGLPLRHEHWQEYLDWAVECFRICANGVQDQTQIHTHMCYSEFNDIIQAIAAMDADVITIETSRSQMELLNAFDDFNYPNAIGPGVYDIHSPNIPSVDSMVHLIQLAAQKIPAERLWINPDCGLKTRQWEEVVPALQNMMTATQILRQSLAPHPK